MEIKHSPLSPEIAASLPTIRAELTDYLDLEENASFTSDDLKFKTHLTIDQTAFVIFEYMDGEGPSLAWLQYHVSGSWNDGCTVSWGYAPDKTIESSILGYVEYNPLD